jgi:hypothetical protein
MIKKKKEEEGNLSHDTVFLNWGIFNPKEYEAE